MSLVRYNGVAVFYFLLTLRVWSYQRSDPKRLLYLKSQYFNSSRFHMMDYVSLTRGFSSFSLARLFFTMRLTSRILMRCPPSLLQEVLLL